MLIKVMLPDFLLDVSIIGLLKILSCSLYPQLHSPMSRAELQKGCQDDDHRV